MDALGVLVVIFALAFLVEGLVEFFLGQPFDMVDALKPWKWTLMYAAMGVGILGAIIYKFDILAILAKQVAVVIQTTYFGMILTGMMIGRGSNYVHDFITKLFTQAKPPSQSSGG